MDVAMYKSSDHQLLIALSNGPQQNISIQFDDRFIPENVFEVISGKSLSVDKNDNGFTVHLEAFEAMAGITVDIRNNDIQLGINDPDFPDLLIKPNPFDSNIHITLQEKAQLNLYDISGKIRLTIKLEEGVNTIPADYLEKGVYIMKISGNERVFNKIMVK